MVVRTTMLFHNSGLRKKAKPYFGFLILIKLFSLGSKCPLSPIGPGWSLGSKGEMHGPVGKV